MYCIVCSGTQNTQYVTANHHNMHTYTKQHLQHSSAVSALSVCSNLMSALWKTEICRKSKTYPRARERTLSRKRGSKRARNEFLIEKVQTKDQRSAHFTCCFNPVKTAPESDTVAGASRRAPDTGVVGHEGEEMMKLLP